MIPILFPPDSDITTLVPSSSLGLGQLSDCISATVTEERNGIYELEIQYPIIGVHFKDITYCSWIKAAPYVGGNVQLFRVYKISKEMNGICVINAEHVSYMLSYAVVKPTEPESMPSYCSCPEAMARIASNIMQPSSFPFTLHTTKVGGNANFPLYKARSVREYLLGSEQSLLADFGHGEYKFNNFDVCLYNDEGDTARGKNNGVKIMYGKNLTKLNQEISDENIITGLYPYWTGGIGGGQYAIIDREYYPGTSQHPAILMNNDAVASFGYYPRIIPIAMQEYEQWKDSPPVYDESEYPTRDDFWDFTLEYFSVNSDITKAKINIDVSFLDLSSTQEYKNIAPLEQVQLCDIVRIIYPTFHIEVDFKVVKTIYNVLDDHYEKISLGSLRNTL